MAMQSEKMQGGASGEGEVGGKIWWNQYQNPGQQIYPIMDERDGFLAWLKGEFAAANVIIDALCHHLSVVVGEAGEYDEVIGYIQQRRCNWSPVLYMQQFFPVSEVLHGLQRAGWRRQQQRGGFEGSGRSGREYHRRGGGRFGQRIDGFKDRKDMHSSNEISNLHAAEIKEKNAEDIEDLVLKPGGNSLAGSTSCNDTPFSTKSENKPADVNGKNTFSTEELCHKVNHSHLEPLPHEMQNISVPKTFVGNETFGGNTFNVVEGMKLYEALFDETEVSKLTALVNDLRTAGRRGQYNAQTFVVSKRPMQGHGREMIQFGLPIAIAPPPDYEATCGPSKDCNVEPIPSLFQDVIERLLAMEIVTLKPDSCIIDIFNEGDHSQPHMWPHWFGRPVCLLFLKECDLTFGHIIIAEHLGDYRGSFKLSLKPGSILTLQGRSADFARHAIPSLQKQRILVTLVKSEPKRITSDAERSSLSATAISSNWVPPPSRSPNHFRRTLGPKHYSPVTATGVLPSPSARSQLPPTNGIQTILVPAPLATPMPFHAPVALPPAANGWPAAAPRHPPPRLPIPGTGVFLPSSGSGSSSDQSVTTVSSSDSTGVELHSASGDKIAVDLNSDHKCSNGEADSKGQTLEQFGENEIGEIKSTAEEGHDQVAGLVAAGKTDRTE